MDAGALSPLPGLDALAAARLREAGLRADDEQAALKLEQLFATMLVKEMRRALADGFFGSGGTGDIYGGWFDEHLGAALADSGTLDLAGMIKTSLSAKSRADAAEEGS